MNVLGLKVCGHDTGAAIMSPKGVVAIGEERLTRVKYAEELFPTLSIEYCLKAAGLSDQDIDLIVVDRLSPKGADGDKTSLELFTEKIGDRFPGVRVESVNHHDAHAASAFYCSPFKEAAILIYDGAGDSVMTHLGVLGHETDTLYQGSDTDLFTLRKTFHVRDGSRFPYSSGIGMLYKHLSDGYIGFGPHSEGKMMGLAAYGDDRVLKEFPVERWVREYHGHLVCNTDIAGTGSKKVNASHNLTPEKIARFAKSRVKRVGKQMSGALRDATAGSLYGDPQLFEPIRLALPPRSKDEPLPHDYYASVAYAGQKVLEHVAEEYGHYLKRATGSDNICIAGGVGLNIDANRNFLDKVGFKNIFVQPAASDSGIALGAALYGYHAILRQPRSWEMHSAALGRSYTDTEIDAAIAERAGEIEVHTASDVAKETAAHVADGKIIGWFQGGSEYGPRALGHRSIVVDPRPENMKDIVNARVKHREGWRPFATSILREKMSDWFDLDADSPFMLLHAWVHKDKWKEIPSVIHVDGTSRLQTVTKEHNGRYFELISEFEKLTGMPLVLNTSFNLAGEPIVETPADALKTFLATEMDYLIIEDRIIKKKK